MYRIVIFIFSLFACWKWGAWKRWREFYPTVLYVIIGDFSYNFVFYNHTLWRYENLINHTVSDILNAFLVFPCIIIIYFTHWPQGLLKQAAYMLTWSIGLTLIEYISVQLNYFSYSHGWNIFWSFGLYAGALLLIRLHYKHPLIVWPISALFAFITAIIFKLPFDSIQ